MHGECEVAFALLLMPIAASFVCMTSEVSNAISRCNIARARPETYGLGKLLPPIEGHPAPSPVGVVPAAVVPVADIPAVHRPRIVEQVERPEAVELRAARGDHPREAVLPGKHCVDPEGVHVVQADERELEVGVREGE